MPFAPQISQFSDPGIPFSVAASLCGPAAAIAFARVAGRNPTLKEVQALAEGVGWTAGAGMAGPGSQQALLRKMGIESDLTGAADPARVRADVQAGKPVILSTGLHYFTASDYDPQSDRYYVGTSGTDLKNGREWMSLGEIDRASRDRGYGGINGALHLASAPAPVPRERQQFLEANSPGGTPIDDKTPPTTQEPRGAPSTERSADSLSPPENPEPAPAMGTRTTARATTPTLPTIDPADAFARQLLAQVGAVAGLGSASPYRLPGPELPGFRPTRFTLPGVT